MGDWSGDVRLGVRAWGAADPPPDLTDAPDAESVARKILLDQLASRPRTRAELAQRLATKGVPDDLAEHLLDRFAEVGLVDDAAFARAWTESRHVGKGLGRSAIARELRRKGVDAETAREALDALDEDDERERARALVRGRLRSVARLPRDAQVRRLVAMLARRGYPGSVAFEVVRSELELTDAERLLE